MCRKDFDKKLIFFTNIVSCFIGILPFICIFKKNVDITFVLVYYLSNTLKEKGCI